MTRGRKNILLNLRTVLTPYHKLMKKSFFFAKMYRYIFLGNVYIHIFCENVHIHIFGENVHIQKNHYRGRVIKQYPSAQFTELRGRVDTYALRLRPEDHAHARKGFEGRKRYFSERSARLAAPHIFMVSMSSAPNLSVKT